MSEANPTLEAAPSPGPPTTSASGPPPAPSIVEPSHLHLEEEPANPASQEPTPTSYRSQNSFTDQPPTVLDWEHVSEEASDAINNVVDNIVDRMRAWLSDLTQVSQLNTLLLLVFVLCCVTVIVFTTSRLQLFKKAEPQKPHSHLDYNNPISGPGRKRPGKANRFNPNRGLYLRRTPIHPVCCCDSASLERLFDESAEYPSSDTGRHPVNPDPVKLPATAAVTSDIQAVKRPRRITTVNRTRRNRKKRIREFQFSELLAKFQEMEDLPPPPAQDEVEMINKQGLIEDAMNKDGGKGERMFELRRIQSGDRAVTTERAHEQLNGLFNPSDNDIRERAPGRESRENIRSELEDLSRNRAVGNLLDTRFREMLENSLQQPAPSIRRAAAATAPPPRPVQNVPVPPPAPVAPGESTGARLDREAGNGGGVGTPDARYNDGAVMEDLGYQPPDYANTAKTQNAPKANLYYLQQTCPILIRSTLTLTSSVFRRKVVSPVNYTQLCSIKALSSHLSACQSCSRDSASELEDLSRNRAVGNLLDTRFREMLENSLQQPAPSIRRAAAATAPPPRPVQNVPVPPPAPVAPGESTGARLDREAGNGGGVGAPDARYNDGAVMEDLGYQPPDYANIGWAVPTGHYIGSGFGIKVLIWINLLHNEHTHKTISPDNNCHLIKIHHESP
eukprot:sb/3462722/